MRGSVTSATGVRCPKCRGTAITGQTSALLDKTPLCIESPQPKLSSYNDGGSTEETQAIGPVVRLEPTVPRNPFRLALDQSPIGVSIRRTVWSLYLIYLVSELVVNLVGNPDDSTIVRSLFRIVAMFAFAASVDRIAEP
jgi:hypothetical protein